MRLPIDTQTVKFAAAGPPESVLDYETRAAKLDENGTAHPVNSQNLQDAVTLGRPLGDEEKFLYTVADVGRLLNLSRTKVYELLYAGQLVSVKIGASRRVRRVDLEAFIRELDPVF